MKILLVLLLLFSSLVLYGAGSDSLLVAHHHDILLLQPDHSAVVVRAAQPVVAFDIHPPWRQLYWATHYYIYRTPLYDRNATTLIIATGRVGSLVVDSIQDRVYWTDLTAGRIEAAHLDGRGRRVVYETETHLGALALDPQIGKLFWIESTQQGQRSIMSINFDGSHIRTVYVNNTIYEHSPLALDLKYKSIYFYKINGIYSEQWEINFGGIEPYIKLFGRNETPTRSLSLADHGFYYSNDKGLVNATWRRVRYTMVYGESADDVVVLDPYFKVINEELTDATQIRVVENAAPHSWQSQCTHHPCEQECIPGGNNTHPISCTCSYGYTIRHDQKICSEDGYLIYSTEGTFGRTKLDGSQHMILYNNTFAHIQSFDVYVKLGYIFWSDKKFKAIYRAPVENPVRNHAIIQDVTSYGVAVDWLHENLYWTEGAGLMVSSLDGVNTILLLNELDEPVEIAVDPVYRYIFWVECGNSLSLRRAGLDGSDVRHVVRGVSCSTKLSVDPNSGILYWLDIGGSLYSSHYDGNRFTQHLVNLAGAMTVVDRQVLFTSYQTPRITILRTSRRTKPERFQKKGTKIDNFQRDIKCTIIKAVKTSPELAAEDICEDFDCPGLCLPHQRETVSWCFCPDENRTAVPCSSTDTPNNTDSNYPEKLTLVDTTAVSVTVQCAGSLLNYPDKPLLHVNELSSLVPREGVPRLDRLMEVVNKTMPIKIDSLNPATTYKVSVRDRLKQEAIWLVAHTAPPPLEMKRLPSVTVPGVEAPIRWLRQGVHYFSPNPWEGLLQKTLILLLLSRNKYYQFDPPHVPQPVLEAIQNQVNNTFMVIKVYRSEEEFDDNPEVYLGNIPWGDEFRLAMVQVTEYYGSYTLDIVYSERFDLPDPYWDALVEDIMDDQIVMDKKLE